MSITVKPVFSNEDFDISRWDGNPDLRINPNGPKMQLNEVAGSLSAFLQKEYGRPIEVGFPTEDDIPSWKQQGWVILTTDLVRKDGEKIWNGKLASAMGCHELAGAIWWKSHIACWIDKGWADKFRQRDADVAHAAMERALYETENSEVEVESGMNRESVPIKKETPTKKRGPGRPRNS